MEFVETLLIIVEVLTCLMLSCIILMQKAKSEGLGMAFGAGAGEALFGARAGNVLTKATIVLGVVFLACTLVLGVLFSKSHSTSLVDQLKPAAATATVPAAGMMDDGMMEMAPEATPATATDPAASTTETAIPAVDVTVPTTAPAE